VDWGTGSMNSKNDIAIVGIGLRLPGGANCATSFWQNLQDGIDSIDSVDNSRWNSETHYFSGAGRKRSKSKTKWGGFIDDIQGFDASFFGITPVEAETLDPQQRILLEVCWNAFEDSGIKLSDLSKSPVGAFIGGFTLDYMIQQLSGTDLNTIQPHTATGSMMTMLSNRLSYVFGLTGPSMSVDTACSSSLVATHLACTSLLQGECDIALAGGVNALLTPSYFVAESQAGMLSPTGRSKTFDASADGYVRGEGAGIVVLKRLADAIEAKDRIYSVIKASGTNQDGHSASLTVPNGQAQMRLMRDVYAKANIDTKDIKFIETHGTGTPVGDPIEANAVGGVVSEHRTEQEGNCFIGSVKTNIGHCEAAAGIAGLIKASLSIYHRELPPHLHLNCVNEKIDLAGLKLSIPTERVKLDMPQEEIFAGVNSFGFGGSNAHVALQGHQPNGTATNLVKSSDELKVVARLKALNDKRGLLLFPLSAKTVTSLKGYAQVVHDNIEAAATDEYILELLSANCLKRDHHSLRAVAIAESPSGLLEQISAFSEGEVLPQSIPSDFSDLNLSNTQPGQLVWVYTGMGPQWWAMGHELYIKESVFSNAFDRAIAEFDKYTSADGWSLREELFKNENDSNVEETRIAQTGNFIIQYALTKLWLSYGIKPDVIVGHSAGEACAAYAAGALSFEDAVAVCYHRSIQQQKASGKGKMIAADLTVDEAQKLIKQISTEELSIAAVNSNDSLTIAGSSVAIDLLAKKLEDVETFAKILRVDIPYHSYIMDDLLPAVAEGLQGIKPQTEHTPLYSTVTGERIDGVDLDASYWCDNVRQPVYFAKAIENILTQGRSAFLELGPHPVLGGSIRKNVEAYASLNGVPASYILITASLNRKLSEQKTVFENLSKLYCAGFEVNWNGVYGNSLSTDNTAQFPMYVWDHKHFWSEPPQTQEFRTRQSKHPILSHRVNAPMPTWEVDMFSAELDYINDHIIQNSVIFPGSGYIEMYLAATKDIYQEQTSFEIIDIDLSKALYLQADTKLDMQLFFDQGSGTYRLSTKPYAGSVAEWDINSSAKVLIRHKHPKASVNLELIQQRCNKRFDKPAVYQHFRKLGLEYGARFQAIDSVALGDSEVLAILDIPQDVSANTHKYSVHPVLGDMCLQTLASLLIDTDNADDTIFLPVSIGKVVQHAATDNACYVYNQIIEQTESELLCDIHLLNSEGEILLSLINSKAKAIGAQNQFVERKAQDNYGIEWQPEVMLLNDEAPVLQAVDNKASGRWVVFGKDNDLFRVIKNQFALAGDQANLVVFSEKSVKAGVYAAKPDNKEDFSNVLNQISEENNLPIKGVIYLWGAEVMIGGVESGPNSIELAKVSHCFTALLQAVTDFDWIQPQNNVWCITDRAQQVNASDLISNPIQAILWGISRVAGQVEHNDIWGGVVDIDTSSEVDVSLLCENILQGRNQDQWAIRDGQVFLPSLKLLGEVDSSVTPNFASDVSYFISGGLGSLGVITANWLIDCGAKHLILASRGELPDRSLWKSLAFDHKDYFKVQTILSMESRGASITHASVDIADFFQLDAFVKQYDAQSKPPITGVYHTAGVAIPELIVNLERDNFDKVLPAKVQGTLNLHRVFSHKSLDAFVLYSSLAAVVTSSGQASYSGANAFLDSFAIWRGTQNMSGLSINWGPWGEVGMAAELNLVDFFASRGFFAMSNRQGVRELNSLSVTNLSQSIVVGADWVTACEVGYPNGEPPAYLKNVLEQSLALAVEAGGEGSEENIDFILSYIELIDDEARKTFIQEKLIKTVSQVLRLSPDEVSFTQSFAEVGLDSMLAIDLRLRIEKLLDVNVAVVDLLKNSPIYSFAEQVFIELEEKLELLEQEILEETAEIKGVS
jgi:acyl transferase domain-containing protein/acyl carrier protein/NADP-dependent 3-hydroxy acid dehydrogenase YdfG